MRRDCERCQREVEAAYDDPRLRKWVKGYFFLGLPFLPAIPIIGSDFVVMLPLLMIYVVGFGPAIGFIKEPPKCQECGAAVAHQAAVAPSGLV
ncbi:hypothetical protein [Enhygromyxa salina]|uniref:Uncharacterized protein n=1 Tax=Enhygromyxa salina TaxID=215803 RepID=A0A2S9YIX3_9BACT|nr:hypothetical protein [Enhygromyxa salina]PRQ05063.1 hypothetical protein ENSA7_48160 [Enhygromyxa salina]